MPDTEKRETVVVEGEAAIIIMMLDIMTITIHTTPHEIIEIMVDTILAQIIMINQIITNHHAAEVEVGAVVEGVEQTEDEEEGVDGAEVEDSEVEEEEVVVEDEVDIILIILEVEVADTNKKTKQLFVFMMLQMKHWIAKC